MIYYIAIVNEGYVIKKCSKHCNKTKTGSHRFKTKKKAIEKIKYLE
jgi:hypothetical protein